MSKNFIFILVIIFNVLPIVLVLKKNFLFKDGILKTISLILYYILFIPVIQYFGDFYSFRVEYYLMFKIISGINLILLFYCLAILFKYSFIDVLFGKREIVPSDLIITFLSYVTMGVSYGFLYVIISIYSDAPAFKGIDYAGSKLSLYFEHIYYSFVTLTTAGYGDITPVSFWARLATIVEILCGIMLINLILGITLSSGLAHINSKKKNDKE